MELNIVDAVSQNHDRRVLKGFIRIGSICIFGATAITIILGQEAPVQNSSEMVARKWAEASSFDDAFDDNHNHDLGNFVALPVDGYIYVIGGSLEDPVDILDGVPTDHVLRSEVRKSGELEKWQQVKSSGLPKIEYSSGTSTISNCIYLVGGSGIVNAGPPQNWVFYSKPDDDGSLSWYTSTLGANYVGRNQNVVISSGNRVFSLGGWGGSSQGILDEVLYTEINPNSCGPLDAWHKASDLLIERYAHTAIAYDQWIYVIGGRSNVSEKRSDINSVEYAIVDELVAGSNPAWRLTQALPISLSRLSAIVTEEGTIYVAGGRNSSEVSTKIFSTTIDKITGELHNWHDVTGQTGWALPYPLGLHSHSSVYWQNGSIYLLGGRINNMLDFPVDYTSSVYYIPPLTLTKSSDPSGPVHEGDVITYTISYANTGLIPQTNIVITDKVPSNTDLVTGTISSSGTLMHNGVISWTSESLAVGETGAVSFQVRIPLLRHLEVESVSPLCTPTPTPPPPSRVLPAAISCDTTRFWAHGVTRQPPVTPPYTIEVQIPPNTSPSEMWLLMKGADNTAPRVEGHPAQVLTSTHNAFGASVWTTTVTSAMIADKEVTVVTDNPRELNALFLFDAKDPPFDERDLRVFAEAPTTFTYTLEIPSVKASTMDVLLPFMDITYWTDSSPPEFDGRMITVTVELEGEPTQTILANEPNMGNGLLMTQFPINLRPFTDTITKTRVLTISVDSEDDAVYTLGPRVCRPVYVENTAWLCSDQAGCISATTRNVPEDFAPLSVYLPIIMKSSP